MNAQLIQRIKYVFYAYYLFLIVALVFFIANSLSAGSFDENQLLIGKLAGQVSVFWFAMAILPGMLARYGVTHPWLLIMRQLRGNFGVAMFLVALLHYILVKIIPTIVLGKVVPLDLFELFGLIALLMTFVLALTSNKFSMRKLGKNWKLLHKSVYVLVWLLFAHVALQEFGLVAVGLVLLGISEIGSFWYMQQQKQQTKLKIGA